MAKKQSRKQRKQIKRTTRHFQLRVGEQYPVDAHVLEVLEYARSQRREVTLIRDAITLLWALEQGNLEALFDKFPQYRSQLISGGNSGTGGSDLAKEIAAQIILQGGTPGYIMQSVQPVAATPSKQLGSSDGIKTLTSQRFDLPIFEDDDDLPTITTKQAAFDSNASANFLTSLNKLG